MNIIELIVPESISEAYSFRPMPDRLGPFGKVNIFVGPNNSGKSRLIRAIMRELNSGAYVPGHSKQTELVFERLRLWQIVEEIANKADFQTDPYFENARAILSKVGVPNRNSDVSFIDALLSQLDPPRSSSPNRQLFGDTNKYARECKRSVDDLAKRGASPVRLTYVPTLRGFRTPKESPKYFEQRTKNDYFAYTGGDSIAVATGGNFYDILTESLLGDYKQRTFVREFEEYVSNRFFDEKSVQLIPRQNDKVIHIKIGTEKEQAIHEVGDGLQHVLTILFAAFNLKASESGSDDPLALFVEEPELFLHPGFQNRLIDCFYSKELERVQLFATTHSNHLIDFIDETARTSIFQVSKNVAEQSEEDIPMFEVVTVEQNDRSILRSLGVSKSSVLLSNCVIMVEGNTDKAYLQRLLELYWDDRKRPRMIFDLHVSVIPYGGSCIADFDFAGGDLKTSRIFGEFLCVADRDTASWKQQRHRELSDCLKDNYLRLPVLEIENLLTERTIKLVVQEYEGDLLVEELHLDASECKQKPLGTLIEEAFAKADLNSVRRSRANHPYAADSGTLKNKQDFCSKALRHLKSIEDFVTEAIDVAKQLDDFIQLHNQR